MYQKSLRKFNNAADKSYQYPPTRDVSEARPSAGNFLSQNLVQCPLGRLTSVPASKYKLSVPTCGTSIPQLTSKLNTFKMSNEPSSPVSEHAHGPASSNFFEPSTPLGLHNPVDNGVEVSEEDPVEQMEMLAYDLRDDIQKEFHADTTTRRQYESYVKAYIKWWEGNEFALLQQNPNRRSIPAKPITPAKVVLFLNYTLKRPRVSQSISCSKHTHGLNLMIALL